MLIQRGYKYRLRLNQEQIKTLEEFSRACRWVWNRALFIQMRLIKKAQQERWYEKEKYGKPVTNIPRPKYFDMTKWVVKWKKYRQWLYNTPAKCLEHTMKSLQLSLVEHIKKPDKKGFPKFKKYFDSVRLTAYGSVIYDEHKHRIQYPKIGWLKVYKDRAPVGTIKNASITKKGKHWYISIQTEREIPDPQPDCSNPVGIDLGVRRFAALSNGKIYEPLNALKKHTRLLTKEQRKLCRKKVKSENWKKQKVKIQKIQEKIANCRKYFLHLVSTEIKNTHGFVVMENLKVANMSKSAKGTMENPGKNVRAKAGLNRSIVDQGWYTFRQFLEYKLKEKGGTLELINPKNTSITCSACGYVDKENRDKLEFKCKRCGFEYDADIQAAINILKTAGMRPVEACCLQEINTHETPNIDKVTQRGVAKIL